MTERLGAKQRVLEITNGECAFAGMCREIGCFNGNCGVTIHHEQFKRENGTDTKENYLPLGKACHHEVHRLVDQIEKYDHPKKKSKRRVIFERKVKKKHKHHKRR
jgi:hypothetical protein